MDLDPLLAQYLSRELRFVASRLRDIGHTDPFDSVYFYSAVYGCLNRALNIQYSDDLCLAHLVAAATHASLANRVKAQTEGSEPSIVIPDDYFELLADATDALANAIVDRQPVYEAVSQTSRLAYILQGNGYYLHLRGN